MSNLQRIALALALALGFIGAAFAADEAQPAPRRTSATFVSQTTPPALAATAIPQAAQRAPADLAVAFSSIDADKLALMSSDEMVATEGGIPPLIYAALVQASWVTMRAWSLYQRWGGQATLVTFRFWACKGTNGQPNGGHSSFC